MAKFQRTKEAELKLVINAIGRNVIKDAPIEITTHKIGGKLKAYCPTVDKYLQFPRDLRQPGIKYTAGDVLSI